MDGIQPHRFIANRRGKSGSSDRFHFPGLQNHCDGDCNHETKRCLLLGRKAMTKLDSVLQRHYSDGKDWYSQSYGFSSSLVQMREFGP